MGLANLRLNGIIRMLETETVSLAEYLMPHKGIREIIKQLY